MNELATCELYVLWTAYFNAPVCLSCYATRADLNSAHIVSSPMDLFYTKQIHSLTSSTRLSLLHGLKSVLSCTNYTFGAVYESIDGPHCFGCHAFESSQDGMPLLTLIGGERSIGRHAAKHQHRRDAPFLPQDLFRLSSVASESFTADTLTPVNLAVAHDEPYCPGEQIRLIT